MKLLIRVVAAVALAYATLVFMPFWAKMAVLTFFVAKGMK